jgi:penicillin-binding protein 2
MFQRRLLFLLLAMAALAILPAAQMVRLTLSKGQELRAEAEKRLITETYQETYRGRILDCKGRELAVDRPSLDVSVDYSVISGKWAETRATKDARKASQAKGRAWVTLSQEEKDDAIKAAREKYDAHLKAMWKRFAQTAGLSEEEVEQRKQQIKEQVQYLRTVVTEAEIRREQERLASTGKQVDTASIIPKITLQEERQAHVMLRGLSDELGIAFEKMRDQTADDDENANSATSNLPPNPGLHVIDSSRREYPLDTVEVEVDTTVFPPPLRGGMRTIKVPGVAMHVIGRERKNLYKEDLERRPRINPTTGKTDNGHYRPGDSVGQGGVEQAREDTLRGLRGTRSKHMDSGAEEIVPREPGHDVQLTMDAMLEARIQALFDPSLGLCMAHNWQRSPKADALRKPTDPSPLPEGTPLNGAVVVIDVKTGDILAMVSMPSYTHEQIDSMPRTIQNDNYNQAFLNRAVAKVYPPGSIVKPLVLCEAIKEGVYSPDERIQCTGHFYPDKPNMFRCWIYKQFDKTTHSEQLHHNLNGAEGIQCSCNIFFFEMGRRLGQQGIHDVFTTYGVGADAENGGGFNIFEQPPLPTEPKARLAEQQQRGQLYEAPGEVKNPEKATSQDAILMGIGQGPLLWTPMHAANAYASIARGGVLLTPRIFADAKQERKDLRIPREAIEQALKGLYGSANLEHGTTHSIKYPDGTYEPVFTAAGIKVWAKSGTADTLPFRADLTGGQQDGRDELFDSDHSWCVCLAGNGDEPQYAIACVLDYGGSGGKVAGPLANQVIYAMLAEGYLR